MIFDHIETLKQRYTDKYVVVDESRPELRRFRGLTGNVKTVNMSGRALVEFDGYNNIGWYDIDLAFLRVVDAPLPKPVESKKDKAAAPKAESPKAPAAAAKPIGEKKPAAAPVAGKSVADILAAARKPASAATAAPIAAEAKPAAAPAKPAPGGKGMSMEDILAAARGKKPAGGPPAAAAVKPAAAASPAAEKPAPAAPPPLPPQAAPAKVAPGGKGMSMEEILAAARGKKPAASPSAAEPPAAVPVAPQESAALAEEPAVAEPEAEEPALSSPAEASASAATSGGGGSKKDEITSVADQVAYCRRVDSKS
jgi:hypothetical protein